MNVLFRYNTRLFLLFFSVPGIFKGERGPKLSVPELGKLPSGLYSPTKFKLHPLQVRRS